MATQIQKPYVLIVEGQDDSHFFEALVSVLNLAMELQIIQLRGRDNLRGQLNAVRLASRTEETAFTSLGIVLDCEENPAATAQMIRHALTDADLPAPNDAHIAEGHNPQVAYMLLPDKRTPGMLEDLCLRAFENDQALECVDEYIQCLTERNVFLSENDESKAKVRAFLASKEKAETRLGIAARKSWWPWNDPAFEEVKMFLQLVSDVSSH